MNRLLLSLKNNRENKIYLHSHTANPESDPDDRYGKLLFHLMDQYCHHIEGYYLIGIDEDGLWRIGAIGTVDYPEDTIDDLCLVGDDQLQVIGIDII